MGRSRIFASWNVPEPAALSLHEFGDVLARSVESAGGRGRREDRAKLHATLHFLGDVDDAIVPALAAALREAAARHRAFDVAFDSAGSFPPRGKPRVVFAGIGEGAAALSALAADVQAALVAAGAPKPDKPFKPHVTLVRVKEPPRDVWRAPAMPVVVRTRVTEVSLHRSVLAPRGAVHTAIATGALAAM